MKFASFKLERNVTKIHTQYNAKAKAVSLTVEDKPLLFEQKKSPLFFPLKCILAPKNIFLIEAHFFKGDFVWNVRCKINDEQGHEAPFGYYVK